MPGSAQQCFESKLGCEILNSWFAWHHESLDHWVLNLICWCSSVNMYFVVSLIFWMLIYMPEIQSNQPLLVNWPSSSLRMREMNVMSFFFRIMEWRRITWRTCWWRWETWANAFTLHHQIAERAQHVTAAHRAKSQISSSRLSSSSSGRPRVSWHGWTGTQALFGHPCSIYLCLMS